MGLRESVIVRTPSGDLRGKLSLGYMGLPELEITGGGYYEKGDYTLWQCPHTWSVEAVGNAGLLLTAWREVDKLRRSLFAAQREAEEEERREPDAMDLGKAYLETMGER